MNKQELHELVEKKEPNICQIAAYKDGELKYSDTFNGYKDTDASHVMSATKSIVSILIGIAIDQGLIKSVDQKVLDFFPEYQKKRGEKTIGQVTVKNLLTMTAPYKYKHEPWSKICSSDDWTVAALDLLGGRAGITGEFKYATLGIHILSGIISKTSGMKLVDFANKYLFEPLGIEPRRNYLAQTAEEHKHFTISKEPHEKVWFCDPKGIGTAGYGLCLTALEMAKIGLMCLNQGVYESKRIVSAEWLHESTQVYYCCSKDFQEMCYGYLWWIIDEKKGIYAAIGNSGNVIYINPEKNCVITVAASFKPTVFYRIQFIQEYVEPFLD